MQLRLLAFFIIISFFFQFRGLGATEVVKSPFRVRLSSAPSTLDWNLATTGSETAVIQNLMLGLFSQAPNASPEPSLVKKTHWDVAHKELRLEVKNGVKWTDQKPLESTHFLNSFKRLLSPRLNSKNASLLFDVVGARDFFLGKINMVSSLQYDKRWK